MIALTPVCMIELWTSNPTTALGSEVGSGVSAAPDQADGSVRTDLDPETEATFLIGGLRGVGYQWLLDGENVDLVDQLAHLRALTRAHLSP